MTPVASQEPNVTKKVTAVRSEEVSPAWSGVDSRASSRRGGDGSLPERPYPILEIVGQATIEPESACCLSEPF
jgi:hypothetical protein